jgi:hypothetical protein
MKSGTICKLGINPAKPGLNIEDLWYRFRLRLRLRPDRSLCLFYLNRSFDPVVRLWGSRRVELLVSVHGFIGSGVQGCIFIHRLHIRCVFTTKASASSGLIQNLKPNWQLFKGMSIFNEDFWSLMPSLSLTLNVEPWTCERLRYGINPSQTWCDFNIRY